MPLRITFPFGLIFSTNCFRLGFFVGVLLEQLLSGVFIMLYYDL